MTEQPALPWRGQCQCGDVQVELTERPLTLYACHCLDCQKASASAYGMSMRVKKSALIVEGNTGRWVRGAGTGKEVHGVFCKSCGCRILHERPSRQDNVNLKPGILNDTSHLEVVGHIWTKRKQPHVVLDDTLIIEEGQPTTYDHLIEAYTELWESSAKRE